MAEILVGTANWADHERFYPPALEKGARQREKLTYYARFFPIVEVDTTFYGIPRLSTVEGWLQRTPPGFRFNVKAYRSLTGHEREGGRPRAAAANSSRVVPVSPSASASSRAVSRRAVWLTPRSRSLTVRTLTPAPRASSS